MQSVIELLREHWAWVAGVALAIAALVKLLLSRQFALKTDTDNAFRALSAQVSGIDERLELLERWEAVTTERLRHIPTIDDFRRLENSVGTLSAGVEKLNAKSEATQASISTMQESLHNLTNHLLAAGK